MEQQQQQQQNTKKLQFQVCFASGEDPDYPATELNYHSPQTKGWQSPRWAILPEDEKTFLIVFFINNCPRVQLYKKKRINYQLFFVCS